LTPEPFQHFPAAAFEGVNIEQNQVRSRRGSVRRVLLQEGQRVITISDGTAPQRALLDEWLTGHADQADIARIIFDEQELHSRSPTFRRA
jgi:hypothetical protein